MIYANVKSLRKQWDDINVYLSDYLRRLDIFILTETNVDEKTSALYLLPGFPSHALCIKGRRREGILVCLSNSCSADQTNISLKYDEALVLELYKLKVSLAVCAVCGPPCMYFSLFYEEITRLFNRFNINKYLVFAGHFNIDVLNTNKHGANDYLDIVADHGIKKKRRTREKKAWKYNN